MNDNIQEVNHDLLAEIRAAANLNYDQRQILLAFVAAGQLETARYLLAAWKRR